MIFLSSLTLSVLAALMLAVVVACLKRARVDSLANLLVVLLTAVVLLTMPWPFVLLLAPSWVVLFWK